MPVIAGYEDRDVGGHYTHSSLVFPGMADDRIALYTDGGAASFGDFAITAYRQI